MRLFISLLIAPLLFLSLQTQALTLHNQEFPDHLSATSASPELWLLGGSVRRVYGMVDTYIGLLYADDKYADADALLDSNSARRMEFHIISERLSARRFINAMEEGLALNVPNDAMKSIAPRIKQLTHLFDTRFTVGTVGYIEWVPARNASRVVIDNKVRGMISGKDLNDALLKIWIGKTPISDRFKQEVLGLNNPN